MSFIEGACERPVSLRFSALRLRDEANQRVMLAKDACHWRDRRQRDAQCARERSAVNVACCVLPGSRCREAVGSATQSGLRSRSALLVRSNTGKVSESRHKSF